jgi:hypothetical protein
VESQEKNVPMLSSVQAFGCGLCERSIFGDDAVTPVLRIPRRRVINNTVLGDGVGDPGAGGRNIARPAL